MALLRVESLRRGGEVWCILLTPRIYLGNPLLNRDVSSLANFMGHRRVTS